MVVKIGVAAHSVVLGEKHAESAREAVKALAECLKATGLFDKAFLLVGGYWGLMRVVVDEALRLGLRVAIIPPVDKDEEKLYPESALVIRTGLSDRARSVALVRSSHVLVLLGGAAGTLLEAIAAYAEGVPVFALAETGLPTDKLRLFSPYVDDRRTAKVLVYEEPRSLALSVCEHLGETVREAAGAW